MPNLREKNFRATAFFHIILFAILNILNFLTGFANVSRAMTFDYWLSTGRWSLSRRWSVT